MPPSSSTVADVALRAVSSLHVKEGEGVLVTSSETRFQDAQGNRIPTGGMRGEVAQQRLGRKRCDSQRERGLQFKGHAAHLVLWRINGREQVLENGGVKVPLQLQNSIKTLIARGRVRIISNEDEDCFEAQVS